VEEYLDIVDKTGNVIGHALRSECHGDPGLIHRAVHVFVFNSSNQLFLQKRSIGKIVQPGKWDASVGGHLEPGETYDQAARREAAEELGIECIRLEFLYDYEYRNEIESENIRSFRTVYDGAMRLDQEEISEGRFWSRQEIEEALGSGRLTPQFEEEFQRYLVWPQPSSGSS
jgi:isopentenyl-diphosphate delta-isomerase type 1